MGQVNIWLKRSYVGLTCVILITCFVLGGMVLFRHGMLYREEEIEGDSGTSKGLHVFYGFFGASFLFSLFGLFGIFKKKTWALIVFTVGIIICALASLLTAIGVMAIHSLVLRGVRESHLELLPLNNATEEAIEHIDFVQAEFHCCGIDRGYEDWMNKIPHSCLCNDEPINPCVVAPKNSSLHEGDEEVFVMIYEKPCLPILLEKSNELLNGIIGLMLGITTLWVLAVVLCCLILCQLNRKEEIPKVVYSKEAKSGNYRCLTEA